MFCCSQYYRPVSTFICFLLPGLLLLAPSQPIHAAVVITGVFKNAAIGERVELYVPHYYVDNSSHTYRALLDGQLQFTIAAEVPEPQIAFLIFGEDQLPVFLEPNDTLIVKADLFQFPLSVGLGGRAGANNRLLKEYQSYNVLDYNEFNNVRFKVGQWWFGLESTVNESMLSLAPPEFKAAMDLRMQSAYGMLDAFRTQYPAQVTDGMQQWIEAEIVYSRAYHLLMYGQVYVNRYQIQPDFFDFLFEAPTVNEAIGCEPYRQFLLVLMSRDQAKKADENRFFVGQFETAGNLLSGKSLAYFQSEIIRMAFSAERYREILPSYRQFLQTNPFSTYDAKVISLYERAIRIAPGSAAPDFSATDEQGLRVSLSSLRGKVVYINFWATWCTACLRKMEVFNAIAPDLQQAGVRIVNVSIDDNQDAWHRLLQEQSFVGTQLLASSSSPNLALTFGVEAVPQYFILARDGTFAEKPYTSQPADIQQRLLELSRK